MEIKEFLKPECKKLILPAILILLFSVVINSFYFYGSVLDRYSCEFISLLQEGRDYAEENNTLAVEQTADRIKSISQNIKNDAEPIQTIMPLFYFLKAADPVIPLPCAIAVYEGGFCEFYINKETYDCLAGQKSETNIFIGMFEEAKTPEYKRASVVTLGFNAILLFAEGYLISSLVLALYRKIRKKKPIS